MTVIKSLKNHTISSNNFYRSLFEEVKVTVYYSTPGGRLLDINPAGVKLFGYPTREELLKVNITDAFYVNPKEAGERIVNGCMGKRVYE